VPVLRGLSEKDRLFREFEVARQMELKSCLGTGPEVCLAGEHYYHALLGYLMDEFPLHLQCAVKASNNYFEFRGIRIFKTHAFKTGFIMGSHEPKELP
jgi:hypothetical protein